LPSQIHSSSLKEQQPSFNSYFDSCHGPTVFLTLLSLPQVLVPPRLHSHARRCHHHAPMPSRPPDLSLPPTVAAGACAPSGSTPAVVREKILCSPAANPRVCNPLTVFRIRPTSCTTISLILRSKSRLDSKNCGDCKLVDLQQGCKEFFSWLEDPFSLQIEVERARRPVHGEQRSGQPVPGHRECCCLLAHQDVIPGPVPRHRIEASTNHRCFHTPVPSPAIPARLSTLHGRGSDPHADAAISCHGPPAAEPRHEQQQDKVASSPLGMEEVVHVHTPVLVQRAVDVPNPVTD
jgi:hypothetical protein